MYTEAGHEYSGLVLYYLTMGNNQHQGLGRGLGKSLLRFVYLTSGVDSGSSLEKLTHHVGVATVRCNHECSIPIL